jgi:hypothetical protein
MLCAINPLLLEAMMLWGEAHLVRHMEDIVDALELPDLKRGQRVEVQEHKEGRMVSELLPSQELDGTLGPATAAEEKPV